MDLKGKHGQEYLLETPERYKSKDLYMNGEKNLKF
jgi:hypothetical protein